MSTRGWSRKGMPSTSAQRVSSRALLLAAEMTCASLREPAVADSSPVCGMQL